MNQFNFKTPHGTDYDKPALVIENASNYRAILINAGYKPFEQKIYFNPLSVSGNFKFRVRHWHWNKHIPATNTGRDVINQFFIDYGDDSNTFHEIDPVNDRITGWYDYSDIVEKHYNKCKEEYENDPDMSIEEFYNRLYSCSVTVTFYIKEYEVTAGLYPDDLESLHEQELNGRIGRFYHDLEMNILFPKLTKMSYDIFYNYTYFEKRLLKDCDRLLEIDPRTFDTLVEQETLESWFENSGVYRLSLRTFEKMTKVTSIKNMCRNSNLQELGFMTFNHLHYINNFQSAFYGSKLSKIGHDLFNIYPEAGELYCESMFAEIPYIINKTDYCLKYFQTDNLIHSLNMWGNVRSYVDPDTFMMGLTTDGYPINIIYDQNPSIDVSGLNCMEFIYDVNKSIEIDNISLSIPSFTDPGKFTPLLTSSQLTSRIVIEASFLDNKVAYDPNLGINQPVLPILSNRNMPLGKFWIKIYSDKSNADIIGINLYTKNQHGIIDRNLIDDEVSLSINGILPKSPRLITMEQAYHELHEIINTDTFFSMYTKYQVSGLFADLPYFQSLDDVLLNPLIDNEHFEYLITNNKVIHSIVQVFKTNSKLRNIYGAFMGVAAYELDPHIFDTTPNLELVSSTFENAKNLIINNTHVDLFKNTPNIMFLNSTFRGCESLTSRVYISHLLKCIDFRYMYANCKGLIIREDLNWKDVNKNDLILDKFGNLITNNEFSIPDYSQLETKPTRVNLQYMYYNINSTSIIMNPINGVKEITYYIDRMYSNIKSYFSDNYLFRNLNINGASFVVEITPTTEYNITCDDLRIDLIPAIKAYGIELLSNTNTQIKTSASYNVFYPEIPTNETVSVTVINNTRNIRTDYSLNITTTNTARQVFKRRSSKLTSKNTPLQFMYVESDPYYKEELEIPYHPITLQIEPLQLEESIASIGDNISIYITNRFIPITINNQTINSINGEFPFSRVELLDTERFKNVKLPISLFKHMFLSTNIALSNSYFINNTQSQYVFEDHISFHNIFPHLRTLNNFIVNSSNFIGLAETALISSIFNNMNILLMKETFLNNINQTSWYVIPSVIEMDSTYKGTSVLSTPLVGNFPNLQFAKYVFENEQSSTANINLTVPKLYDITGIFKGSLFEYINENPFIGSSIEIANEMFMNANLHIYSHILDTHPVKYINRILDGCKVRNIQELVPLNTITHASYAVANCSTIESISIDFIRKNIDCLIGDHLFYKTPINANYLFLEGMINLLDASYILAENDLNAINENFFKTNTALISLEGALYKHKMELIPDNLLFGINNLKSLKAFTAESETLIKLPNLGCLIKKTDTTFDFSDFANSCVNVDFLQKKFTDIIYPYDENNIPTLNIQNSLNQIKASFTDIELANGKFLITGKSNAIYTPNASVDITGLNEFILDFTYQGEETLIDFKIWDYQTSELKSITNVTQFQRSKRCVIFINDKVYGLNAELDEPFNPQNFPRILLENNTHYTIKIYTEAYGNESLSMANAEVLTIGNLNNTQIPVTLSGYLPIGPVVNQIRNTKSIKELIGNFNLVDIYHLKMNNELYNDAIAVPSAYFRELNIESINLDYIKFSPDHMVSMFENCIHLKTVNISNPILCNGNGVNLTKFFYNCPIETFPTDRPLTYYFNILTNEGGFYIVNTPINMTNMFYGCKLTSINKIISLVNTDEIPITFKKPNNYNEIIINLSNMYQNSSVNNIDNGLIEIVNVSYRSKRPAIILNQCLDNSKIVNIPQYALRLGSVCNVSSFRNIFSNISTLTTCEMPLIQCEWYWDFTEFENDMYLEGLFQLSTNLKWERNTIHHLIEYTNEEAIPYTYHSYAMLENIISNNPDDKIFRGVVYIGDTLAIYINIGPDIKGMNKFTMIFDLRKLISSDYLFRIYGPTNSVAAFTDLTNSNTSILNSKLFIAINDDLPNAIEYYPDESKSIKMVSVTTNTLDQRIAKMFTKSRDYDEEYAVVKFDIYTDSDSPEKEIHEFLSCLRANQSSLVLGIQIEGPIGYSKKYQDLGILLLDILGKDAETKLYSISDDTYLNYNDFIYAKSNDPDYNYGKSLLSGIKGCDSLGGNIFKPFTNMNSLVGILSETQFKILDENIFKPLINATSILDLFANATLPNNLNENHFNGLTNLNDISGMCYKAKNTTASINTLFSEISSIITAKYLYAYSDLESPHVDMFRSLINLENNDYGFYKTQIKGCPTIYKYNNKLNSIISLFEASTIETIADRLLADKPNLQYIDSFIKDCESLYDLPENVFENSNNIDSATYMAYNTPELKTVSSKLLRSFGNCRYIDHFFEKSGLLEYQSGLMDYMQSVISATYIFANIKNPYTIPDRFLSSLTSANTLKGAFSGDGNLNNAGVDVLPHSTSLESIEGLFKSKRLLENIDDDYFKYTPAIKNIDSYFDECSSLNKLPNISYLTNLETTKYAHRYNLALNEIPDNYYIHNRKAYDYQGAYYGSTGIVLFGKSVFDFSFELENDINLTEMFDGCSNINLHYDLIDEYIKNTNLITGSKRLLVENMFNSVKTFLDEDRVWAPVTNKVGDSGLNPTDPPSTDIDGLNMFGYEITPSITPMNLTYHIKTLHNMKLPTDTTSFYGRVVVYIDDMPLKAYDNNIYYAEKIEDIILPDNNKHTIKIYTENPKDLVVIHGLGTFISNNLDNDEILLKLEELPKVKLLGSIPSALEKLIDFRLIDIFTCLEPEQVGLKYIGYPIIEIPNTILKNINTTLPRLINDPTGGFFSGLYCSRLPNNLITKPLKAPIESKYEISEGLICNNPKLLEIPTDIISALSDITKLTYFVANCISLNIVSAFIPIQNTIKSIDYMCYNCISLTDFDEEFSKSLNDISANSFLENCSKFTSLSDNFINNFKGKFNSIVKFAYNSSFEDMNEKWIDLLADVNYVEYAFAKTKIQTLPVNLFSKATHLRSVNNKSAIEGMFSDILTLRSIEGSLGLQPSNRIIKNLFANSTNLEWGNKRVGRLLYIAPPKTAIIDNSFANIRIPLDNDAQLFDGITITGNSNAIFTGRIPPSTDTTGLTCVKIDFNPTSTYTLIPRIKTADGIIDLTDTKQLKNRLVFKLYKINTQNQTSTLVTEIGYDHSYEEDKIKPFNIEFINGYSYRFEIYTKNEYIGFNFSNYINSKLYGVLPLDILNIDDTITPISEMFGSKFAILGDDLLSGLNKTKLDLSNTPFNLKENLRDVGSLLNILVDQEILDNQFDGCSNLTNININALTKLKSIRYLFRGCASLNLNITQFMQIFTQLEDITGLLENATYNNLTANTFKMNTKLKYAKYVLKDTQTNTIPENLFIYNIILVSIAGAFMNCPLTNIPNTLGCNPGCYSIERVYFNCRTIQTPLTRTVAQLIYNGQPADTVKLIDAFYQVPVKFNNESEFIESIRFTQGSTGAIFKQ